MEQVTLHNLARSVGRIGFGCSPLGEHGWGTVDRSDMIRAVHFALDNGINLFDVADIYGLGRAEESLGDALYGRRDHAVIVSKFGVKIERSRGTYYDTSPAWIEAALNRSLQRLRTDVIDIYLMHYWDEQTPIEDILETLERARSAGKIRSYGLTNANPMAMLGGTTLRATSGFSTFSLQYNLLDRHFEGVVLRNIEAARINFLSWGSLAEGLLSGKFAAKLDLAPDDRRWRYRNFIDGRFEENLRLVEAIAMIAKTMGRSAGALALRWILDQIPRSVALVGMKSTANVASALEASDWSLPTDVKQQLDQLTKARYRRHVPGVQFINSAGAGFAADLEAS